MIEFCYSLNQMMKFPPMPLGGVRLQNCGIVLENKNLVDVYGRLESVEASPIGLDLAFDKIWCEVKSLERRIHKVERVAPNQVVDATLEALRIYGAATNEMDPNFVVLRFWIGLEKMIGLGQDIREADVSAKLKSAFRNKPTVWDLEIDRLLERRNKMVHRAIMEATAEDAYFAKILYGFTLGLLLEYGSRFSRVESIRASFELGNRDSDTLAEVGAAVERLLRT
jgi:hypothetical protein